MDDEKIKNVIFSYVSTIIIVVIALVAFAGFIDHQCPGDIAGVCVGP